MLKKLMAKKLMAKKPRPKKPCLKNCLEKPCLKNCLGNLSRGRTVLFCKLGGSLLGGSLLGSRYGQSRPSEVVVG